ncbi:MAG TPA: hypothetical protein VMK05_16855 [Burkholderiales bacterium]|nr:hypothetical protein [Burkholderiales bacterium]
MAVKITLCISAYQATVARWMGKALADCAVFPNDDDGYAGLGRYLESVKRAPVYVLVDAVEEDYRYETLPHSFGSDRKEMVDRRLKQLFRGSAYCSAWLQGRDSGKRRDDRYLFSALTNPDVVTPWLQVITRYKLPVAGVYLLPMAIHALVQRLALRVPNFLLVSQHAAGLRLSFFRDGNLRISRLTRVESPDAPTRIGAYAEEIGNTRLYLHALRIMTLDEPLAVVIVDRDDSLAQLAQAVGRETSNIQCQRLGRAELSARLKLPVTELDPVDALYLHVMGGQALPANLAPTVLTETFSLLQIRHAVYATAAAAGFACAAWSSVNAYQIYDVNDRTSTAARQTATFQAQYLEVTRQFPAAPTSAENLQRAIEIARKLKSTARTPEAMMALVSRALDENPRVTLNALGWRYGAQEVDTEGARGKTAAEPPPGAGPAMVSTRKQSAYIDAEIRPFTGDYRSAIADINALAERLQREPTVAEVRVVKYPLNVNPGTTLSGSTLDDRTQQSTSAPFKIIIVLKPNA